MSATSGADSREPMPDAGRELVLHLDLSLYSLSAVKKAAYRLSGALHVFLEGHDNNTVTARVRARATPVGRAIPVDDFLSVLVDEDLREQLGAKTEPLRNLILAHALSRVPLINADLEATPAEDAPELTRPST